MDKDSDLSPSEFVANIRRLGEKKDQEDAERLAKLEEEIEIGRRERELRRAERARSISPEKQYARSSRDSTPASPRGHESPSTNPTPMNTTMGSETPDAMAGSSTSSTPPPTATQLARSGTLSWQQRPKSRGGEGRRPLSWLASENAARSPRGTPEPARSPTKLSQDSTPDSSIESSSGSGSGGGSKELSRAQIAESLGSKDPTWFRQTPEGGRGSAAYRRNAEEDVEAGASAGKMRLPGMQSRGSPISGAEPSPTSPPPLSSESTRSNSPSRTNSVRDSTFSNRFSTTTVGTDFGSRGMKSPPASVLDGPKLDPPPSDRRTPTEGARPPSPTKGMGGFVESAMLKRADSVSKRWSQTSAAGGLARSGSAAGNRSSYLGGYGGGVLVTDRTSSALSSSSRDASLEPSSRPTSSHSNQTITQNSEKDNEGFVKPSLPSRAHSRSKSVASLRSLSNEPTGAGADPPSPSKRWSPTKSSWLESALTKEEKPKVTGQAPPAQPSWMAEINKAKQQRAASPTKEAGSPFGGAQEKPLGFGREALKSAKKPETPSPAPVAEPKNVPTAVEKIVPAPIEPAKARSPPPEVGAEPTNTPAPKGKPEIPAKLSSPPPQLGTGSVLSRTKTWEKPAPSPSSPANAPGKFDFRSQLKSRAPPPDSSGSKEPEFKNALGNLKRAKTQNYVAPDTLKDNITRGKAGLNITGGVPERKRVDELKEQLNKQKAVIQARKESGELPVRVQKPKEEEAVPEGLMRRKTLQSGGERPVVNMAKTETPEAVAALRGLVGKGKPDVVGKEKSPPPPVKEKRISAENSASIAARMGASSTTIVGKPAPEAQPQPTTSKPLEKSISAPEQPMTTKPTPFKQTSASSKLADRFNPALANMLARGPPGAGGAGGSKIASPGESPALSRTTSATLEEVKPGPELEHKTKGRARGPKRRAKGGEKEKAVEEEVAKEETKPAGETPRSNTPVVSKPAVSTPVKHARLPSVQLVRQKDVLSSSPSAKAEEPKEAPAISRSAVATPTKHFRVPSAQLVRPEHVLKSSPVTSPSNELSEPKRESLDTPASKPKPVTPTKSPQLANVAAKPEAETKPQTTTPGRLPLREHQGNVGPKPVEPLSPTKTRALPTPRTESPKKDTSKAAVGALFERRWQAGPPARKSVVAAVTQDDEEPPSSTPAQQPLEVKVETPKKETASKSAIGALFEQRFQSTAPSRSSNNSPTPATEDSIAPMSVRDSTALFARQESPGPFSSGRRSPIKLPTKHDEEKAMRDAGLMPPPEKPNMTGLGISAVPAASPATIEVAVPRKSPLSPPLSVRASPVNGSHGPKTPAQSPKPPAPAESPIPHTSEATRLFGDFFDERPVAAKDEIDTLSVLESSPLLVEKVTTVKKSIQEITNDGKLTAVPSHQEHMLFDQSMYVCVHAFTTAKGVRSTEVYLWAGSDVSPAALEDAQLFTRRVARDNNGKLLVIQQGQETPNFLQALGGILITFRGSKSRNSIGVPPKFILCGRRHLGHVVFDEVDFTLHSFCSGFPYLISTNNRLYLWKGIGSHQEELSSARLITMDVSPTPDLTETEEGKEPASFFALFPPLPKYPKNSIPRSADHWRLRPRHENYAARLFRVDMVRSKSVSLQVSSFFSSVIKRRPSWSSFGTSQPSTPTALETPSTGAFAEPSPTNFEQQRTTTPTTGESTTTKIVEVVPFGQMDLKADGVFILDAFFEIYVIIGPLAQSQAPAFSTALAFAQDYGILAASMQDRPFVPVSTVVLEGAPRDMKFCFRYWDNEKGVGGTEALMAGSKGLRRAGSLRCVGLSAALASLRVD